MINKRSQGKSIYCTFILLVAYVCILGSVNLYQKFEIEKYTVCGKLILPKKWKGI